MTISQNGSLAYVVASRTAIDRTIQAFDDSVWDGLPVGQILTTVDLASNSVVSQTEVCSEPLSVDLAPNGLWLLIACRDNANELTVVELDDGVPTEIRPFDLDDSSKSLRGISSGATYGVVHPSGAAAGVVLNDHAVTLVRFELDENGVPNSAQAEASLTTDRWLSVARWTHGGNYLLVADVAWGPAPTDAVFNGPGAILSVALSPDTEIRGVVSEATVSKSPEAFEMNRAGDLLAVVNMERTYLPGGALGLIPGRAASSLSLVGVDDAIGTLTTFGEAVGFSGVLPEDAVFDSDGDQIAVVVYQDHDAPKSDGWIAFFDVDSTGPEPKAVLTDRRVPLPRGGHDLFVID